jgi:uncharacterized membrane protein YfcA
MEILLGFIISVFIALTGVGAGSLTTPLLILLLGMPANEVVGTALIFGAVVKLVTVPTYLARGQVNLKALTYLLGSGLPGVLVGALLLHNVPAKLMTGLVGMTIMSIALLNLARFTHVTRHDRTPWLAALGFPIGVEMGFSSAGAGAIGALGLMGLTTMPAASVVGTDLAFGLGLSLVGGGIHAALGSVNTAVLWKLILGGVVGAILGSSVATKMPSKKLKFALCVALVVIGAQLSWKSFSEYYDGYVLAHKTRVGVVHAAGQ